MALNYGLLLQVSSHERIEYWREQRDVSFLKKTEGSIARGEISPTCWMIGRRFGHPYK